MRREVPLRPPVDTLPTASHPNRHSTPLQQPPRSNSTPCKRHRPERDTHTASTASPFEFNSPLRSPCPHPQVNLSCGLVHGGISPSATPSRLLLHPGRGRHTIRREPPPTIQTPPPSRCISLPSTTSSPARLTLLPSRSAGACAEVRDVASISVGRTTCWTAGVGPPVVAGRELKHAHRWDRKDRASSARPWWRAGS